MTNWKLSLKATAVGTFAGTVFGLAAFFYLATSHQGMGSVLFLLVPVVAAFSAALIAPTNERAVAGAMLAVIASLIVLVATGKEGLLCAVLAFPIIALGVAIGFLLGGVVRRWLLDDESTKATMGILLLIGPMLVFAGDRIERPLFRHSRTEVIETSITLRSSPERTWDQILTVDNVQASKPALMYIGLPIPERCTLQGKGVGAKRTCYFNSGYIEETIIGWGPPYYMGLRIDRTHMPGRHWLGFENAEYRINSRGNITTLKRTTTISSDLRPSWYWRIFERLGVESEHRYILQDVALKVSR